MPSKGSPRVTVRIPPKLYLAISEAVESRNATTAAMPVGLSEWIKLAVCEKLNHLARSKRRKVNCQYPSG